jgi:hypothetical protein
MAASDYVPIFFKNRLHLAGRPQMSTRPTSYRAIITHAGHMADIAESTRMRAQGRFHKRRSIACSTPLDTDGTADFNHSKPGWKATQPVPLGDA